MEIKATQEFERIYELKEEYYLTKDDSQRVKRTLTFNGEVIANEDFDVNSTEGSLRLFVKWLVNAYKDSTENDVEIITELQPPSRTNILIGFATVLIATITILLALILWKLM